jgi:hypothetical protein
VLALSGRAFDTACVSCNARRRTCSSCLRLTANAFALGARNGVRMILTPSLRKTSSKPRLSLLSWSWTRKRIGATHAESDQASWRACCATMANRGSRCSQRDAHAECQARSRRARSRRRAHAGHEDHERGHPSDATAPLSDTTVGPVPAACAAFDTVDAVVPLALSGDMLSRAISCSSRRSWQTRQPQRGPVRGITFLPTGGGRRRHTHRGPRGGRRTPSADGATAAHSRPIAPRASRPPMPRACPQRCSARR